MKDTHIYVCCPYYWVKLGETPLGLSAGRFTNCILLKSIVLYIVSKGVHLTAMNMIKIKEKAITHTKKHVRHIPGMLGYTRDSCSIFKLFFMGSSQTRHVGVLPKLIEDFNYERATHTFHVITSIF